MSDPNSKIAPWEDAVLRAIAIYKFIKAALALVVGLILFKLIHHDAALFLQNYILAPLHFDPEDYSESHVLTWLLQQASDLTPHTKRFFAYASFFYTTIFAIEGAGLYLKKHWAEYMVLIVTASFLPFEAWLLFHHRVWWKFCLIVGNILIIAYLYHRIRLDARLAALKKSAQEASLPVTTTAAAPREFTKVP